MAKQALETIKESEEKARQIVEQANADAVKLVEDANRKAEQDIVGLERQFHEKGELMKKDAWARAEEQQADFAVQTQSMAEELKTKLTARKEEAVDAVIKTIAE